MTRLLISTAVAGLLALGGTALAQDHHDDHPQAGHTGGGQPQGGHEGGHAAAAARVPMNGGGMAHQGDHQDHHQDRMPDHQAGPAAGNAMRGPAPGNAMRGNDGHGPGNAMRGNDGHGPGNAMRGPGGAPHRDYSSFHRNFSAPHHFRAPSSYNRPNGWYAHRWSYGEFLPSLFWTQNYWLNDYDDFGLMAPPDGAVWVRDGNDALLIDQDSSEIIQVEYGVFY